MSTEVKTVGFSPLSFFIYGLTLLFIGLKLSGVIDWSWWWVLSPILIELAIIGFFVGIILVIVIAAFIISLFKKH